MPEQLTAAHAADRLRDAEQRWPRAGAPTGRRHPFAVIPALARRWPGQPLPLPSR